MSDCQQFNQFSQRFEDRLRYNKSKRKISQNIFNCSSMLSFKNSLIYRAQVEQEYLVSLRCKYCTILQLENTCHVSERLTPVHCQGSNVSLQCKGFLSSHIAYVMLKNVILLIFLTYI
jgi:hypothetical protein